MGGPDYGRGEVRRYLRDNALRWLENRHCDGLRWDATGWIRNVGGRNNDPGGDIPDRWNHLQWINSEIRNSQPWKISIAEDMQDNEWLTRAVGGGGAGFGAQWGAGFLHTVRTVIIGSDDGARDMYALRDVIAQRFNGDAFRRVVYTESHDEVAESAGQARVPELIWRGNAGSYFSQKRATLGAALVLTAPGIPMLFMGQEFLEPGAWSDARELDWSKLERFSGIRALYRDLIRLRRNWFDTTRGLRWTQRQRPPRQRCGQDHRLSPLGPRRTARRCSRAREPGEPVLRPLPHRSAARRSVARSPQQRLARLQRRVHGSAQRRPLGRFKCRGRHAVRWRGGNRTV